MNADRRKKLDEIRSKLEDAKWELESVASDERDAFDNMPESLQQGERGQAVEQAADTLDEAASDIDDILSKIEEAKE